MLQDTLHATQGLDHVCAVVVEVPELPIVALMGPPEWVLLEHLRKREEGGRKEGGRREHCFN